MFQKSYDNTPTLYLIPTPIGHLEDITIRAINILRMVDAVFCEDTRETAQLLNHLEIKKPLFSSHKHNEKSKTNEIIKLLEDGKNVGLVSDRGTPIISDPGYEVVKIVIEKGYNVVSLPGPTAIIPAITSSGINPQPFLFFGFLDSKEGIRKKQLLELSDLMYTIAFYESPHRLEKTLKNMKEYFGNRRISISREISKRHEEVYRGDIDNYLLNVKELKGEFVIIVEGSKPIENDLSIEENINIYIKQGFSVMDAIKKTAKERKLTKSDVYNTYHKNRGDN
jgi:16S rRNA (cytidine1402-2'-O)-methyltransferase